MPGRNDVVFQNWCELLNKYLKENCRFPVAGTEYDGAKLGNWLRNQATFFKKGTLSEDRIKILDAIHPAWRGTQEERETARTELLLASNWQANVPEGHTPISPFFQEPNNIAACLDAGIYDLEGFVSYCEDKIPFEYSRKEETAIGPFTRTNRDAAFKKLFPTLTYNGVVFQKRVLDVQTPILEYARYLSNETFYRYTDQTIVLFTQARTIYCRHFFTLKYGLVNGLPLSTAALAEGLGVSKTTAYAKELKGIHRFRHPSRSKWLSKPYFLEGRPERDLPDFGPMGSVKELFVPGVAAELECSGYRYVSQLKNLSLEEAAERFTFPDQSIIKETLELADKYQEPAEAQNNRAKHREFWKKAGVENVDAYDEIRLGMLKQAYAFGCTPEEMREIAGENEYFNFEEGFDLANRFLKTHVTSVPVEEPGNKKMPLSDRIQSAASRAASSVHSEQFPAKAPYRE